MRGSATSATKSDPKIKESAGKSRCKNIEVRVMEERIGVSHERNSVRDLNPTRNFLLSLNMDLKVQISLTNSLKLALLKTGPPILGAASESAQ